MIFVSGVVLKLLWLLAFAILPGLCLLDVVNFRYRSRLDLLLAVMATGISVAGGCVYLLLLVDFYCALSTWLILLLPAGWLIYRYWRTGRFLPEVLAAAKPGSAGELLPRVPIAGSGRRKATPTATPDPLPQPLAPLPAAKINSPFDGVALFCCGFLLLMHLFEAATSPLHTWDAVITWDKWATEWALRSNLYHCSQGGYPQLLAMFSSLLYKITGHLNPLAQEQYALHAFHPLLGVLLLLACVRVAQLLEVPVWGVLVVVFGFGTLQDAISAGGADLLVTLLVLVALVLYLAWLKRAWSADWRGVPVLVACVFGAAFTKVTGLFAILLLLLLNIPRLAGTRLFPKAALTGLLGLPLLLLLPFYWFQYASSREPIERMSLHEVNFRFQGAAIDRFQNTINASYAGAEGWHRFSEAGKRFLTDYSLPQPFTNSAAAILPGILLLAAVGAGFSRRPLRPVSIAAGAVLAVWYRTASYDLRNLLPALPLLGVCVTGGAIRLLAWLERFPAARFTLASTLGLFAIAIGSGAAAEAAGVMQDTLLRGNLGARFTADEAGFPQSAKVFFPHEYEVWSFLARQGLLSEAPHTVAISPLYRWVPSGIYAACDWNSGIIAAGDLFIGPPGARLPGVYDWWTKLWAADGLEAFIVDRKPVAVPLADLALTGASPPRMIRSSPGRLDAQAGGNESMLVYNLPNRDARSGISVVWQVTVQAEQPDSALRPCSQLYNPRIADPALSATAVDLNEIGNRLIKYSGVLAIPPVDLSQDLRNEILFGVCRNGAPQQVSVLAFRYSIYNW